MVPLSFTTPPLSLNDRGQTAGARRAKSAAAKTIKDEVHVRCKAAKIPPLDTIHVRLHWVPSMNRRRDPDNMVATLKPCIDGIVAAGVVVDDHQEIVDWSRPLIHPPDRTKPRMWLEITDTSSGTLDD